MYKFIIKDKEFTLGKLSTNDDAIFSIDDQARIIDLAGITFKSFEIEEPTKVLTRNNSLRYWSFKETLGKISFNISISGDTEQEKLMNIYKVKNMLANESLLQIYSNDKNEYYKVILLFGTIEENIKTSSFNIVYGFKKDDVGVGIYPLPVSNIISRVNYKEVTIKFKKGGNSVSSKIVVGDSEIVTSDESITLELPEYDKKYSIDIYSISETGIVGAPTTLVVKTIKEKTIPGIPTNIEIKSITGKSITIGFVKGVNALKTEIVLGDIETQTYDEEVTILTSDFNKSYNLKLRSISADDGKSEYSDIITVTTSGPIIPLPPTINLVIEETFVTFLFSKDKDVVSTEFIIDGKFYTTSETCLTVDMKEYNKQFTYKARSMSSTESFSDYTLEATATTGPKTIVPTIPTNISVSIIGSVATFNFTNGTNSIETEFVVDGVIKTTDGTSLVVDIGAYSKTFTYKARSKSSTGTYSDYTIEATATTETQSIVPTIPTNISVSMVGSVATFKFTKGTNATSTEFIVDGVTKTTDGTSLVVDIGAYSKTFKYKARSKSSTGTYSDYTIEATATTGVQSIVPTIPTNITVSIVGSVATFNFTKGTNATSTQFLVDGATYTTTGTSLVADIEEYGKTFKYKARSKSSTNTYSEYTVEGTATTEELITSLITFNLVGKIAGSMTECPIKITLDEEEVTQQEYNDAKGNVGLSDAEIYVDFSNFVETYYGGSRANFIKDLISIRLPTDGGGYLFDYRYYEYETTKKSIITSGFSSIITGANKFEYKVDMATNLSLQIEVKSNIQIETPTEVIPTVPTGITIDISGKVATFNFTKGDNAESTEFIVDGVTKTTDGTTLVVDIGSFSKTFKYKARSKSSTQNYSDYTIEATATTGVRGFEDVLLYEPIVKNNCNSENTYNYSPKDYVNGAVIEIEGLVAMNANRYSVGASVINGTLVER